MSNLSERSFSGIIYGILFISAILFSEYSYIALISIFGFFCIWEFSKLIQFKSSITYLLFVLIIFLFYNRPKNYGTLLILIVTLVSSFSLMYKLYAKKEISYKDERSKLGITMRYLIFSLGFLVSIPFYNQIYQPYLILNVLVLIWTNDSFAFIVGKNFGKQKLFKSISPKKTIEGFIGGLLFSLLAAYIISIYEDIFTTLNWMIIALIVSILGTIGDLIESKFKRQANVKDSGNIMPGHGGNSSFYCCFFNYYSSVF